MFLTSKISLLINMAFTAVLEVFPIASTAISIVELALVSARRGVVIGAFGWSCDGSVWHGDLVSSLLHCSQRASMGFNNE